MTRPSLTRRDVEAAAQRLADLVRHTPCLRLGELERSGGPELWAKCENLQLIGAFKARGAMHAASRLSAEQRSRGLVTYSSGNHAQAVALAARHFGVPADIAMPEDAPTIKVESVERLGATIHVAGTTSPERKKVAEALAGERSAAIIEPFDHPDTICGQGTATLELLEQMPELPDALVVPVGGGGLIAGACLACGDRPIDIIAVEPVGCDALTQSLQAGRRVPVTPGPTLADGLKPTMIGELNFELCRSRVTRAVTVHDDEIGPALVTLLTRSHLLIEPSAAAALAAARALNGYRKVAVLLSGGNVDPGTTVRLLEQYAS